MPVVYCKSCGRKNRAPDAAIGKKGKCAGCGAVMVIPAQDESEPVFNMTAEDSPPLPTETPTATEPPPLPPAPPGEPPPLSAAPVAPPPLRNQPETAVAAGVRQRKRNAVLVGAGAGVLVLLVVVVIVHVLRRPPPVDPAVLQRVTANMERVKNALEDARAAPQVPQDAPREAVPPVKDTKPIAPADLPATPNPDARPAQRETAQETAKALNVPAKIKEFLDAVQAGDVDRVRAGLAANPIWLVYVDKDRFTPLHYAAASNRTEVAKFLIDKGADINAASANGCTPLHSAAGAGHKEAVLLLVEQGAKINVEAANNLRPIHSAVQNAVSTKKLDLVVLMLEKGADPATMIPATMMKDNLAIAGQLLFDCMGVQQELLEGGRGRLAAWYLVMIRNYAPVNQKKAMELAKELIGRVPDSPEAAEARNFLESVGEKPAGTGPVTDADIQAAKAKSDAARQARLQKAIEYYYEELALQFPHTAAARAASRAAEGGAARPLEEELKTRFGIKYEPVANKKGGTVQRPVHRPPDTPYDREMQAKADAAYAQNLKEATAQYFELLPLKGARDSVSAVSAKFHSSRIEQDLQALADDGRQTPPANVSLRDGATRGENQYQDVFQKALARFYERLAVDYAATALMVVKLEFREYRQVCDDLEARFQIDRKTGEHKRVDTPLDKELQAKADEAYQQNLKKAMLRYQELREKLTPGEAAKTASVEIGSPRIQDDLWRQIKELRDMPKYKAPSSRLVEPGVTPENRKPGPNTGSVPREPAEVKTPPADTSKSGPASGQSQPANKAKSWLSMANQYIKAHNLEKAKEYARRIVNEAPDSAEAGEAKTILAIEAEK